MTRTILVTGGLGYLGGRICHYLNTELGLAVRLTTTRDQVDIPGWASELDIRQLDMRDVTENKLSSVVDGVDAIIHLAALNAQQCEDDPAGARAVNVDGTQALMTSAARYGVDKFIYMSTAHVYRSPLSGHIDELVVPSSSHPYATTRLAAEEIVLGAKEVKGIVFRLSNATGAPMDEQVNCWMLAGLSLCRYAVIQNNLILSGDGSGLRDFICMSDVLRAVAHTLNQNSRDLGDGLFNIGQGRSITILSLAERIITIAERETGQRPSITFSGDVSGETHEPLHYICDKFTKTGFSINGDLDSELYEIFKFCQRKFGGAK
jgi:UDP-glucose 4-epimerase